MNNEEKKDEIVEEAKEAADEAKDSAEEAKEAAEETKEAVEEVKEVVAEVKSEVKEVKENSPAGEKPSKEVSKKLEDIISDIEKLTVLELADLVKALEERFGVTAAAPMAVAGNTAPASTGEAGDTPEEGQTSFNVVLTDSGANKISVIKAVREIVPTLGLKEAKDLVDSAPKPILEGAGKDAANEAKTKIEAAGGKVELK